MEETIKDKFGDKTTLGRCGYVVSMTVSDRVSGTVAHASYSAAQARRLAAALLRAADEAEKGARK